MGRNRPKEGKIVEKMHFFLHTPINLTSPHSKTARNGYCLSLAYDLVHRVTSGSGATSKTILTRCHAHRHAYTRIHEYARAFQQRCCFFAVTSVTLDCFLTPFFEDFPNHIHPKSYTPPNDFLRNKGPQIVKVSNQTVITLSFTT